MTPSGAWLTKVNALVRRVLWLERSTPEEKCLVFSQFPEALSFVRNALTINKVKCASITSNNKKVRYRFVLKVSGVCVLIAWVVAAA